MTWAWHTADDAEIRRAFIAVACYGDPATLIRARDELGHHMRVWPVPGDVDEIQAAGGNVPESHRLILFGTNHRPWNLGRLRHTLARDRGIPVRVAAVADTGADSFAGFSYDILTDEGGHIMQTADSFGLAGAGVLRAVQGTGEAVAGLGEGLGDAGADIGSGLGDAARGAGGAISGFGAAASATGAGIAASPISGTIITLGAVALGLWVAVKAGVMKPIRVGR